MSAIGTYLDHLIYGYYPYLVGTVFLVGSLLRYDHGQFTWKTGSSQMLSSKNMRLGSNLFHIGIIVIFFGHLFGMLTPHWVYSPSCTLAPSSCWPSWWAASLERCA